MTSRVSPHFTLAEFACHDGREVPAFCARAVQLLCNAMLEPLREEFGPCRVVSGYRPADYNARIGGAADSRHIYDKVSDRSMRAVIARGVAADVVFARGGPSSWAAAARARRHRSEHMRGGGRGGVGLYVASGFVHVDTGPRRDWRG